MQSNTHHLGAWVGGAEASAGAARALARDTSMADDIPSPPVVMSATAGPLDANDYYYAGMLDASSPDTDVAVPPLSLSSASRSRRPTSRSPNRKYFASASPATANPPIRPLNAMRSTPVLLPSRPAGSVRNIASRFDTGGGGPQAAAHAGAERYRRPVGGNNRSPTSRSPTRHGVSKLPKRRPVGSRSPAKLQDATFDPAGPSRSVPALPAIETQPHAKSDAQAHQRAPLFGEITADGQWNGNFDLGIYGKLPAFRPSNRANGDEVDVLSRGRSHSHQEIPSAPKLSHRRSRSEMDPWSPPIPSADQDSPSPLPIMYPPPLDTQPRYARATDSSTSRTVAGAEKASDLSSPPSSPARGPAPNSMRARLAKSPTRRAASGKENATPNSPLRRYDQHSSLPNGGAQVITAKMIPGTPPVSPPLRSSRPRQSVSSATTSASRARAVERAEGIRLPRDPRQPSEQWLGKPYDAHQERSKRPIPQLGMINFAERRARIMQAVSQNLDDDTHTLEKLRNRSQSRQSSGSSRKASSVEAQFASHPSQLASGPTSPPLTMPGEWPSPGQDRPRGLNVVTTGVAASVADDLEPMTAHTEFEEEASPTLGNGLGLSTGEQTIDQDPSLTSQHDALPALLTPATYVPAAATKSSASPPPLQESRVEQSCEPLDEQGLTQSAQWSQSSDSRPGTDFGENTPSAGDSSGEIEDRWGLTRSIGDQESIRIMFEDESRLPQWPAPDEHYHADASTAESQIPDRHSFIQDSPVKSNSDGDLDEQSMVTPRKNPVVHVDSASQHATPNARTADVGEPPNSVTRMLHQYRSTGSITAEMFQELQKHTVDLQRLSANGGSNGIMVQNLLDSIFRGAERGSSPTASVEQRDMSPDTEVGERAMYEAPLVTPDTPPGWRPEEETGTATVYRSSARYSDDGPDSDDDFFAEAVRKADEAWENQQHGDGAVFGADSSVGGAKSSVPQSETADSMPRSSMSVTNLSSAGLSHGLQLSVRDSMDSPAIGGLGVASAAGSVQGPSSARASFQSTTSLAPPSFTSQPQPPSHAPPPPPPASAPATRQHFPMTDAPQIPASLLDTADRSPILPRMAYAHSASSRPSSDSQRAPLPVAPSVSASSLGDSTRQTSFDTGRDGPGKLGKAPSPGPEQKRLQKRRHVIKELLDTENTYHQDLKIIEDIYRATATPDLVSADDKKVLFGNCDEIERFSLHFYDELRKAVTTVYVPAKSSRWLNKRSSYSTTQSDGTGQASVASDGVDAEKDRASSVGQAFLQNLPVMEQVYSAYLKNHDAANRRLAALRNTTPVQCWLNECHNNASDITMAWDLDSLLVKPTQRVAKYPMLLQQLLETTPHDHPDRESLASAARDSVAMLTRINEAKKRADLVDQIVNRKVKDTDVRTGIAKAFGRRTEKLKERVGMAEAFQDPEFDELAHKFGGHFIRLQICMRDVQEYLQRIDKSMEQINGYASAIDTFADLSSIGMTEIQSKWRKYGQVVREVTGVAFAEHKAAVTKRVVTPMIACIKLHDGPQDAIHKRKKRIIDYAKCKGMEKRGEKPDRRTIEAAEMYEALNEQLKIDLPRLYSLTASLVQGCLNCFLDIQLAWYSTWERKLRPVLDIAGATASLDQIESTFKPDFDFIKDKILELGVCNGAVLAEAAMVQSPSTSTLVGEADPSSTKVSFSNDRQRTSSMGSDSAPLPAVQQRASAGYGYNDTLPVASGGRLRSNSALSQRAGGPQYSSGPIFANRPWSNGATPTHSFSGRHSAGPAPPGPQHSHSTGYMSPRLSTEQASSPRPGSTATYFTAQPDSSSHADTRFSGIFSSAVPAELSTPSGRPASVPPTSSAPKSPPIVAAAPADMPVLFVCASLFEFSIDRTRREAGYPYLTYVQGEVFDVVAQKGELWLAKNQDDRGNGLGWIWEQHFVILSQE